MLSGFQKNDSASLNHSIQISSGRFKILSGALWIIVLVYPVAGLFSKYASDICFYLLFILSVWVIVLQRHTQHKAFFRFLVNYWPLWLAISLFFWGELFNSLFVSGFRISRLLLSFRFMMVPLLVYGLLVLSVEKMKQVQWGLICSAVLSGIFVFIISDQGSFRAQTMDYVGIWLIPFANLSLLVGFMAFLTVGWDSPKNIVFIILKILALLFAIYGAYLSETRASWIAILILGAISSGLFLRQNKKIVLISSCIFFVILAAAFLTSTKLQSRVNVAQTDIAQFLDGTNKDTSIGIRLQLYEASWIIFTENPLGINRGEVLDFRDALSSKVKSGVISSFAAQHVHAHNEFLQRMVRYGVLGGVAVIAMTLVPLFYFFRCIRSRDKTLRTIAYMGIVYNVGFFIFGLSDVIYEWRITIQFYVVMLSVLLALLIKRRTEIGQSL